MREPPEEGDLLVSADIELYDRYADRHPGMPLDKVVETVESDDVSAPEQIALRKEAYGQLRALIGQLPVLQQQVLQLRYEDGLRFAEIAVVLNKREDAVRKLLSRTLTTLRTLYLQQEGGRA